MEFCTGNAIFISFLVCVMLNLFTSTNRYTIYLTARKKCAVLWASAIYGGLKIASRFIFEMWLIMKIRNFLEIGFTLLCSHLSVR